MYIIYVYIRYSCCFDFAGLDYKKLTDGTHNPLDVIRPILTSDNIHSLAKVASKIPLTVSLLLSIHCLLM